MQPSARTMNVVPLGALALAAIGLGAAFVPASRLPIAVAVAAAAVPFAIRLAASVDPAVVIGGGLMLTLFNSNWSHLGVPTSVAPDRMLLLAGSVLLLARVPAARDRPKLRIAKVHVAMAAVIAYGTVSALRVGSLSASSAVWGLVDRLGVLPFAMFVIVPMAFHDERRRSWLLAGFVAVGAYLGLTSVALMIGPHALVWPRYILDPNLGIHYGRARGPFLEATVNGLMMFGCAIAALIASRTWRTAAWRRVAIAVAGVCAFSLFLTLQRSVWIGGSVAVLVTMLLTPGLRRYVVGLAVVVIASVGVALAVDPGLALKAQARSSDQETVWQRQNIDVAAVNMIKANPLLGVGWNRFTGVDAQYAQVSPSYPFDITTTLIVHNVYLSYAAELGLIGLALWGLAFCLGVGGAIVRRGPPSLVPWRIGLLAIAIMWLVAALFSPLLNLPPNILLWAWAGVVFSPWQLEPSPA